MTRYEEFRRIQLQLLPDARLISARITPNVGDPYSYIFKGKPFVTWEHTANFSTINIAVNTPDNPSLPDLSDDLRISYITGVPDLIGLLAIVEYFLIDKPMRIGEK